MIRFRGQTFEKKLQEWVDHGLISHEQAHQIKQYEEKQPAERAKKRVLFTFLAPGGFFLAFGLVLIIAHNWENIPPAIKITGFLTLFLITGEALIHLHKHFLYRPLALLYFFFPLIGISLYGQIYQLSGTFCGAMFLWGLFTLPLMFFFKERLFIRLHIWITYIFLMSTLFSSKCLFSPLKEVQTWMDSPVTALRIYLARNILALIVPGIAWGYIVFFTRRKLKPADTVFMYVGHILFLIIYFTMLSGFSNILEPYNFLFVYACVILYTGGAGLFLVPYERIYLILDTLFLLSGLYFTSFLWGKQIRPHVSLYVSIPILFALVGILASFLHQKLTMKEKIILVIFHFLPFFAVLPFSRSSGGTLLLHGNISSLIALPGFLIVSLKAIIQGSLQNHRTLVRLGVWGTGLLIITRFLHIYGTMLATGIGFIITGGIIIGLALGLRKFEKWIRTRMESTHETSV